MYVDILGGNGVVGHGICSELEGVHKIRILGRGAYNFQYGAYAENIFHELDCLIHAAGVTNEELANSKKEALYRSVVASESLFDMAGKVGGSHLVYLSSVHVYGALDARGGVKNLKASPIPEDLYGICHLASEWALQKAVKKYKLKGLILRLPSVYGFPAPGHEINRVSLIPYDFPRQLFLNKRIFLKSLGAQQRNFCSNIEVGELVKNWLDELESIPGQVEIVNMSGEIQMSVRQFALACVSSYKNITGVTCNIITPDGDMPDFFELDSRIEIPKRLSTFLENYFDLLASNIYR